MRDRAGLVAPQTGHAGLQKAVPPAPHRELRHASATDGLEQAVARAQRQDDAGPPDMLRGRLQMVADLFQALAVGGGQDNGWACGLAHDQLHVSGMNGPAISVG